MEDTAKNIDRLVTTGAEWGGRLDRQIVRALYESASQKVNGKPFRSGIRTGDKQLLQRWNQSLLLKEKFEMLPMWASFSGIQIYRQNVPETIPSCG